MNQKNFTERLRTPLHPDGKSLIDSEASIVVNSANNYLRHGSGVARMISDSIPHYQEYCDAYMKTRKGVPLNIGSAISTPSFNLREGEKRKHIIHAIGMGYRKIAGRNSELIPATTESVQNAVLNTLRLAKKKKAPSLSFSLMCSRKGGLTRQESVFSILSAIETFEKTLKDHFSVIFLHCMDELDEEAVSFFL